MSYSTFPFYFQRFTDSEGNPLAGGSLTFYAAGSTALKDIYLDQSGTPAQNPMPLDSTGLPVKQYFGGSGEYDIIVKNSVGAIISKSLRINASGGGGGAIDSPSRGYFYYNGSSFEWRELSNVIVTWAIIDNVNPDILQSLLDGWDTVTKEKIYNAHWGIASNENDDLSENTSNSKVIYFLEKDGDDEWVWIKTDLDIEYPIINFAEATLDYLHAHYDVNENEPSNYPSGIWTSRLFGDSYEWVPMNVREFPEPVFSIDGQLLRYRHSGSAGFYEWVSEDLVNTGKVKVDSEDPTSGYLENKVVSGDNLIDIVKGAGTVGKKLSISLDVDALVTVLNGRTDLTATPKGPAGGDLFGTYPNPRVKELTGVPAMLTPSVAGFNWKQSGSWASGAGIGFGFGFVNGVQSRVWMAISQLGELQVSYDEWKSEVYIPEGMPYRNSFTDYDGNTQLYNDVQSKFSGRYAAVTYLEIPGTGRFCWVFGAEGALRGLEAVASNFYANGAPKLENMFAWTYNGTDPNTINSNGTVMVFTGNSSTINYAEAADIDWDTKTINAHSATVTGTNASSRGVIGGNGCDGSSFMCVGRDSGIVMQSADGKNWTVVDVLSSKFQDGTSMTKTSANEYTNALPMNTTAGSNPSWGTDGNAWGGMLYANDMWIVVNGKPAPSTINTAWSPFMFSYDKSNWNGYMPTADELAVNYSYSMYKIAYGHGKTFATNSDPYQDYKNQPAIYRLLMDEIPAHRKLVAEKGMDVIGTLAILDLPNASFLGTDENGKIIVVSGSSGNFIRNQATDGTNDAPGNIFLDPAATINIRYEDVGTPANNVNWFSVSKDMLKLQGLDVNNPALIGYQAELTPSALALRGRPGTSYGIYNAAVIMNREQFNWVPNATDTWYSFFFQDLGGGTAQAKGGYSFPRLKLRISDTDTVSAELVNKIVDSNGNELSQVTHGAYGKALQIPTTIIAGTPNAQQLFDYSISEGDPHSISQAGTESGNNYGNRGFAFVASSSRTMTKARMMITQTGGSWMRMGIYDSNGTLLTKSNRVAVASGMIWFPFISPVTLVGGNVYYLAYWCDDTTGNLKFPCIAGRATYGFNPLPQVYDINNEMPNTLGTSGTATGYRPWMMISE